MTLYIELEQDVEQQVREKAMKRFGYTKGALKQAIGEAVVAWVASIPQGIEPLPLSAMQGILRNVKEKSVELKHAAGGLFGR